MEEEMDFIVELNEIMQMDLLVRDDMYTHICGTDNIKECFKISGNWFNECADSISILYSGKVFRLSENVKTFSYNWSNGSDFARIGIDVLDRKTAVKRNISFLVSNEDFSKILISITEVIENRLNELSEKIGVKVKEVNFEKGKVNNMNNNNNNNNVIEELAFMDEKLDKILEQQGLIMKKLGIMNKEEYITTDDFDFVGTSMEGWFKDVAIKLSEISGLVERKEV